MARSGTMGRRLAAALAAASLGALIGSASAWGVAQPIVAGDDFFTASAYTMDQGDRPAFQNAGNSTHNATARQNGPDGKPLFLTPDIGNGSATVNGSQYLTAGTYGLFCTIHPLSMTADLIVSGNGAAVARPRIDVLVRGNSLSTAARKGKLPVRVAALTASEGVELAAKLGKSVLGTQKPFNLAAGQTRKITLKLTRAGRNRLAARNSAKVTVTGSVAFGAPDTAKKTLK